jgi:hypothetical protein
MISFLLEINGSRKDEKNPTEEKQTRATEILAYLMDP